MKNTSTQLPNDMIYGVHPIIEVLKAKKRKVISIYTTKPLPEGWERIKTYLPQRSPMIQYVSKQVLDKMTGTADHNNIVAWVSPFKYSSKMFTHDSKPFILMLDGIQDVRNLGAILRSAYCAGVDGVILCKKGSAALTPASFKASAGLAEHLSIYVAPSAAYAAQEVKNAGYNLYMAVLDGKNATEVEFKRPLCLIIGNEAVGISKNIQSLGEKVTLPQRTADISYNASVAAGILMFLAAAKTKAI
ncbi:MAG: RNA methyltransferase [Candidatus Babeliales bacterium]|jgi:23S rRNA (guanosine2251-2'-O)-methyltransferase